MVGILSNSARKKITETLATDALARDCNAFGSRGKHPNHPLHPHHPTHPAPWLALIEAAPAAGELWARLKRASLDALAAGHVETAARLGWQPVEIFGVYRWSEAAIPTRVAAQGLVPGLALSPLAFRAVDIGVDAVTVTTEAGNRLVSPRKLTAPAVCWWLHPALLELAAPAGEDRTERAAA